MIMAHLLGDAVCMESLQRDISDLQVCIVDVSSRIGPVRCQSWKYPDKQSCDLDMTDLLDTYRYTDDEEDTQVAHIVLYELLIDRLLLYIQSMSKYTEGLVKADRSTSAVSNTSVGVITSKFWNKMVKLHSTLQQLQSDTIQKTRRLSETEHHLKRLQTDCEPDALNLTQKNIQTPSNLHTPSNVQTPSNLHTSSSIRTHNNLSNHNNLPTPCTTNTPQHTSLNTHSRNTPCTTNTPQHTSLNTHSRNTPTAQSISHDCTSRSSQTYKTAFVPCEECAVVQKNLRHVGDGVINICKQQGIPSALQKFKPHVVENDWLSANEISEWVGEQNKDFIRITKQIDQLTDNVTTLKSQLSTEVEKCKKLQSSVNSHGKEMRIEKEDQSAFRKQSDVHIASLQKEHTEKLASEVLERKKVLNVKGELESQLTRVTTELRRQTDTLKLVEEAKANLEQDLQCARVESDKVAELSTRLEELNAKHVDATSKLQTATKDLAQEQAKNKSAAKYQQSVESKQDSLLQKVNDMDEECEELRSELGVAEDEREQSVESKQDSLLQKVNDMDEECEELRSELGVAEDEREQSVESKQDSLLQKVNDMDEECEELRSELGVAEDEREQSVESKQDSLLQKLNDMDEECEELRSELGVAEDEREQVHQRLMDAQGQVTLLQEQSQRDQEMLAVLTKEKENLEGSIGEMEQLVDELRSKVSTQDDKERLLVEYPDLNGPVRTETDGSGDVATDMQNQITANDLRIDILERQNVVLRNTVNKMIEAKQAESIAQIGKPIPLWTSQPPDQQPPQSHHPQYKAHWSPGPAVVNQPTKPPTRPPSSTTTSRTTTKHNSSQGVPEMIVGRITSDNKVKSPGSSKQKITTKKLTDADRHRHMDHKNELVGDTTKTIASKPPTNDAAIKSYINIKRNNLKEIPSPREAAPKFDHQASHSYTCTRCDKLYTTSKELDIHTLYCFGKLRQT